MNDKVLTPALEKVLAALAAPGTRWHSPQALVDATGLTLAAVGNALQDGVRHKWVIHRRVSPSSWARQYSITTTGEQARNHVSQLELAP